MFILSFIWFTGHDLVVTRSDVTSPRWWKLKQQIWDQIWSEHICRNILPRHAGRWWWAQIYQFLTSFILLQQLQSADQFLPRMMMRSLLLLTATSISWSLPSPPSLTVFYSADLTWPSWLMNCDIDSPLKWDIPAFIPGCNWHQKRIKLQLMLGVVFILR